MLPFRKRISVRLALISAISAFILGLLLSLVQLWLDSRQQERVLQRTVQHILAMAEGPAVQAVYHLHKPLAQEVVNSLLNYDFISKAQIIDELGKILASGYASREESETHWFTHWLIQDDENYIMPLHLPGMDTEKVGKLSVVVDWDRAWTDFFSRWKFVMLGGILFSLFLVGVLIGFFFYLVTKPLTQLVSAFDSIDPYNPAHHQLPVLPGHRADELGLLVRSANAFLAVNQILMIGRQCAERALFEEKERAEVTLHSIADAVIRTDKHGIVEYLNPAAEMLTGWGLHEARGQSLDDIFRVVDEQNLRPVQNILSRCLRQDRVVKWQKPLVLLSRDGKEYAIQDAAAPIHGRHNELTGAVLTFSDITEVRRLVREINHQARHDALTGLVNRREFERRLQRILTDTKTHSHEHAFCYLDLDRFKLVNDTCGHGAGDELLRQISILIQGEVRKRDTLARLGGDEFGVLLEHCSLDQAMRVADALRKAIENFHFLWGNRRFNIGVSIGLVAINAASESLAQVMSAADSACYLAKETGRNRIHLYRLDDERLARQRGEMQWIARIHQALAENRFRLDFQLIDPIDGSEGAGVHYELLLRMEDAELGLVLPSVFLPAAERYGLAIRIDRWVISTAFAWLNCHPQHLQGLYLCAINLSALSLGDEEFLQFVVQQFERNNIPPNKICFEITETAAVANFTNALHFTQILKAQGCRFALDDFGSGLSSFNYLKNFPVDFLKIDGTFIKDIVDDPVDLAIVKSINEVGHVIGKQTIAEFVENAAILDKLRNIGVDYAQGYGIGRPQSLVFMTSEPYSPG